MTRSSIAWIGLVSGPVVALACYFALPTTYRDASGETVAFTQAGRATLAILAWMAVWWMTEAIDLAATALLPLVVFPLTGVAEMGSAAAPYAHPLILLFMGGFLLAMAMQRWGLDRRIALRTLALVGTQPKSMVGGFMLVTATLSGFVSNTATTAMMLPIAASVVGLAKTRGTKRGDAGEHDPAADDGNFATCLLLGVAYAASIGGIATLIGSPPNVVAASFMEDGIAEEYRQEISFVRWISIGLPLAAVLLPLAWLLLTRFVYPLGDREIEGGRELIRRETDALGRAGRGEWVTGIVCLVTAMLWVTRPLLADWNFAADGEGWFPLAGLTDTGIAMAGAIALFVIPVDPSRRVRAMNWETARCLPWGILILFGGGLSLARAVKVNGVAEFLGAQTRWVAGVPEALTILLVVAGIVFLTELTSNTATAAALIPVLAAMAPGLEVDPRLLVLPAAIAASCAFMLPVATPPNAIVFGAGHVTMGQMIRAGLWLNLIAILLIELLAVAWIAPLASGWR